MSGIYIPGVEVPDSCCRCRFCHGDTLDGMCLAAEKWYDDEDFWSWYVYPEGDIDTSKPLNCPAIPVPDHGRLIDADIPEDDRQVYGFYQDYDLQQLLDSRPTIIPAEEGET